MADCQLNAPPGPLHCVGGGSRCTDALERPPPARLPVPPPPGGLQAQTGLPHRHLQLRLPEHDEGLQAPAQPRWAEGGRQGRRSGDLRPSGHPAPSAHPQLSSIDLNDQVEGDDRAFEVWHEREDSVRKYLLQARTVITKNSWVKEICGIQQRLVLPVWRECQTGSPSTGSLGVHAGPTPQHKTGARTVLGMWRAW